MYIFVYLKIHVYDILVGSPSNLNDNLENGNLNVFYINVYRVYSV